MVVSTPASAGPTMTAALAPLTDLPAWLQDATDPERVADALVPAIPELASGDIALVACDVGRVRLRSDTWVGTCLIEVTDPGSGVVDRHRLRLELTPPGGRGPEVCDTPIAPLGSRDWRLVVPELRLQLSAAHPDETLPALRSLIVPEMARELLERGLRQGSPRYSDLRIASCAPEVMRHKPGSRCTVRYRLEFHRDRTFDGPAMVVGKTWHGLKGANAYAGMRALWRSDLAQSPTVRIAEPLAFLPEENVLIQSAVPESLTFDDVLERLPPPSDPGYAAATAEAQLSVVKIAHGLAHLHGCGVGFGESVSWEDEVAEISDRAARLGAAIPELRGSLGPLLAALGTRNAAHRPDPQRPSHRSFRPAQVLLHGDEIAFIDFDGLCQAEPALDVALFLTMMREHGLRSAAAANTSGVGTGRSSVGTMDALCDSFLSAYEAVAPISRARVALWEALDLITDVLACWTKAKPERLALRMTLLHRHLERMDLS
jgi:Phosphotransferase enzyme family